MLKSQSNKINDLALNDLLSGLGATIFESIGTPFGIFGMDFEILWINRLLATIHRCSADQAIGKICYETFHGCDRICENCFLEEVKANGRTVVLEKSHVFPSGKERWGEIHAYPIRGKDKSLAAIAVLIFDTTTRIKTLAKHKAYSDLLSHKLSELSENSGSSNAENHPSSTGLIQTLSNRETEVLRLVVDGYTNPQISQMLNISGNTVKRHMSNLFLKLDVSDRTQAAVRAIRERLI